jgi:peptidoglycan/xylan/chitin deacetylase (PgdA/CDA1 family)
MGLGVALPASPASAAPATVVTLTFDDGNADQMAAVQLLQQYNLAGTFYIISGSVGAPGYVTRANLDTMAGNGNEIGGHTVSHPDLTSVPLDEARRQVCNDRVTLSNWGYPVKSFAYPYAAFNPTVEQVVSDCGYNSARTLGDIESPHGCQGCPAAGPIPPADPFNIPAVHMIDSTWTLAEMQSVVTQAEQVGGWVPFTFHHVCSGAGCGGLSITPEMFGQFLSWLSTRPSSTSVKTVDQVIGGPLKPPVNGPPATGSTDIQNPSLETAGVGGFPQCWFPGGYGTNSPTWTRLSAGSHTGTYSEQLDMSGYSSGDAKLLPTFDLGGCSPNITAGNSYTLGTWYKSTTVTQFVLYYRNATGGWFYWTSSPWFAAASDWTQATWTAPAAPATATGISFGLSLFSNGSLVTDDYSLTGAGASGAVTTQTIRAPSSTDADATPHHRAFKRRRQHGDRVLLPGGKQVAPGTRVAIPFEPYR